MSKTLLMIIEPAALQAAAFERQQRYYQELTRARQQDSNIVELKAVKAPPSFGVSLLIYGLHTGCLLIALGLSSWWCLVMLAQLLGRAPLW